MLRPIYALWTARRRLAYILCVDMFSNSSTGWQHWDQGSLVVRGGFRSQTKMATVEEIMYTVHSLKEIQLKAAQETSLVGAAIKYSVVCLCLFWFFYFVPFWPRISCSILRLIDVPLNLSTVDHRKTDKYGQKRTKGASWADVHRAWMGLSAVAVGSDWGPESLLH